MKTIAALEKKLTEIANREFVALEDRADLETHRNGEEDFFEVAVWELKAALLAAYELGRRANR